MPQHLWTIKRHLTVSNIAKCLYFCGFPIFCFSPLYQLSDFHFCIYGYKFPIVLPIDVIYVIIHLCLVAGKLLLMVSGNTGICRLCFVPIPLTALSAYTPAYSHPGYFVCRRYKNLSARIRNAWASYCPATPLRKRLLFSLRKGRKNRLYFADFPRETTPFRYYILLQPTIISRVFRLIMYPESVGIFQAGLYQFPNIHP